MRNRNILYPILVIGINLVSKQIARLSINIANYYLNKKCLSMDFHASKESYFFLDFVLIYMYIFIIFSGFMSTYKQT